MMLIVSEKINTSRKSIEEAVRKKDATFIANVAREQAEAGADYIDVNAGTFLEQEVDYLCWLVETVQSEVDLPLSLDSPNPKALSEAMKRHKGEPMINSISLEEERFKSLLPVITSQPCRVVALCMAKTSMPTTTEERVQVSSELIEKLTGDKPHDVALILTGCKADARLVQLADLVTEMVKIKHPCDEGMLAQKGIDF